MAMSEQYTISALPRITFPKFVRILSANDYGDVPGRLSPMLPHAAAIYAICIDHVPRVDPSVAMAFFFSETEFGTTGLCASKSLFNPGNVRRPYKPSVATIEDFGAKGKFARYPSWLVAVADWCDRLTSDWYAGAGLLTIDQVVPVYSPSSDHNNVQARIDKTYKLIGLWS